MTWFEQLPTLVRWAIEGVAIVVIVTVVVQLALMVLVGFLAWRESRSLKSKAASAARRRELHRRRGMN